MVFGRLHQSINLIDVKETFSVPNILNIEIMIYVIEFAVVNNMGHVLYQEVRIATGTCKTSIKRSVKDK